MLQPRSLGLMASWKLSSCGLVNKCAVCTCSGGSARDSQTDFPRDNATGILPPPSGVLAFLLHTLPWRYRGGAGLFNSTLPPGYRRNQAVKSSISWDVLHYLSVRNKTEAACLCYEVWGGKVECLQYTGNNNKTSNVDGQKLVWKKERELGNSSQVRVKKVCVLEG